MGVVTRWPLKHLPAHPHFRHFLSEKGSTKAKMESVSICPHPFKKKKSPQNSTQQLLPTFHYLEHCQSYVQESLRNVDFFFFKLGLLPAQTKSGLERKKKTMDISQAKSCLCPVTPFHLKGRVDLVCLCGGWLCYVR